MIPLQIASRDFSLTTTIRHEIEKRAAKLGDLYRRAESCDVTLSTPHRRHRKGRIHHVSVRVRIPGADLVVNHESEEDISHQNLHQAIHDAFFAVTRQLEDRLHEMRGFAKAHAPSGRRRGKVKEVFAAQDYGILESAEGDEIYFHRNSLKGTQLESLNAGAVVRFEAEEGDKGMQAVYVRQFKVRTAAA